MTEALDVLTPSFKLPPGQTVLLSNPSASWLAGMSFCACPEGCSTRICQDEQDYDVVPFRWTGFTVAWHLREYHRWPTWKVEWWLDMLTASFGSGGGV